jgi:3-phosphoshikimate 1-carboxyvinyltransferase
VTTVEIAPGPVRGVVDAPPSKSYTHRALVAGLLSAREHRIERPLASADTVSTARALRALGATVRGDRTSWTVRPSDKPLPPRVAVIDCRDSGTTLRFLLPAAARLARPVRFIGSRALWRRPVEPLLNVLERAHATVKRGGPGSGIAEVVGPIRPVRAALDASESSQFLSALLLTLPTLDGPSTLRVGRTQVSRPYVAATLRVLSAHGVTAEWDGRTAHVPGPQRFRARRFRVPGDASSAAYLWAAAAASGGSVRVRGIDRRWPQADLAILDFLRQMGAEVRERSTSVEVRGPLCSPLRADFSDSPDLLPLASVLAACIPRASVLTGAAHASEKESDRRTGSARLARAMGARVRLGRARLEVRGGDQLRAFRYSSPGDHRMAMSAAVGSLAAYGPSTIAGSEDVVKSFPGFWEVLADLGAEVERRP